MKVYASKHSNPPSYTVEEEVSLTAPEWTGLAFSHWTDEKGNEITGIQKGTTGNLTLTANWKSEENLAIPSENNHPIAIEFDAENNRHYFIYKLGIIDNIVLKTVEIQDKEFGEIITWKKEETVTAGKNIADTIAKVISTSMSKTLESSEVNSIVTTETESQSLSVGLEKKDLLKIEGKFEQVESFGTSKEYGEYSSSTDGYESSDEISSMVSFTTESSEMVSTEASISADMPKGTYRNVCVGKLHVYAIVTYDHEAQRYYIDTYSVLDEELRGKRLYNAPSNSTANIAYSAGLPMNIDVGNILTYLDSVYCVEYEANGGVMYDAQGEVTTMLKSVHTVDKAHELSENQYVKEGYTWIGWKLPDGSVKGKGEQVSNLGAKGEVITVKAEWTANMHTVQFDPNGGSVSESSKNVYYDSAYGTLPTPWREGYTFSGWKLGDQEISSKTVVKDDNEHTLVAQWTANSYTIVFNANGGSGSDVTQSCTYDKSTTLTANGFTRGEHIFLGWSTDKNATIPQYTDRQLVLNWLGSGSMTLYAVWLKTEASANFSGRTITLGECETHNDWINTGMSKEGLVRNGYTTIEIVITFDTKREDLIVFNKAQLAVVGNGHATGWNAAMSLISQKWTTFRETFTIDIATHLNDDGSFTVHWEHLEGGGNGEHWLIGSTTVTATAK